MRIVISSGHGKHIRGARGNPVPPQLDEVDEARKVVERAADYLRSADVEVVTFHDDTSHDQNTNLSTIVNYHNSHLQPHDLDVSVHFNAYSNTSKPMGTECLYVSQQHLALDVANAISKAGELINRSAKYRSDLYFLNKTKADAILIETCFCDSTADSNLYNAHFDAICKAIAEAITGKTIGAAPPAEAEAWPLDPLDVPLASRPMIGRGDFGPHVADMQKLIPNFGGEVDGDFGPITEQEVTEYQATRGLAADGICGPQTWQALYENRPPLPAPPHALSGAEIAAIAEIAMDSRIAGYAWEDRGIAPPGYVQGMALAFAQSYRKLKLNQPAAVEMAKKRTSSDKDALNIYRAEFETLDLDNETAGAEVLRNLYALMLGHGMRESSGRHCEGRDLSADNVQSDTAEAGLFQTSYNAHSASDPEFGALMTEYSNPAYKPATCYLGAFEDGVSCTSEEWGCFGSGEGYAFQKLAKECPAFAVETCALTLRNLCNHYGPIIRKETELKADAAAMFDDVQHYLERGEAVA